MARQEPVPERLMAYLDGEMSETEAREFEALMEAHPEWREEVAEMAELIGAMDALKIKPPPAEVWDNYWEEIDDRISKRVGWVFLAIGGALLSIVGIYKILLYATDPWIRVGLGLLIVGFLVVFISVLRGHLLERPKDKYRNVKR